MAEHDPESTLPEAEKISDESDRASDIEMRANDTAIREIQAKNKRDQEPDADGRYAVEFCVECDNPIGEGRLQHSIKNTLCIHCATALERRR